MQGRYLVRLPAQAARHAPARAGDGMGEAGLAGRPEGSLGIRAASRRFQPQARVPQPAGVQPGSPDSMTAQTMRRGSRGFPLGQHRSREEKAVTHRADSAVRAFCAIRTYSVHGDAYCGSRDDA